jgi:hypothetical protein
LSTATLCISTTSGSIFAKESRHLLIDFSPPRFLFALQSVCLFSSPSFFG